MEFNSLVSMQAYFCNERVCAEYLEQQRWNGTPICPHCGSEHHYRTKTRFKNPELKDYKDFFCKACRKKYTVLTGTAYESTKISLRLWLSALYLLTAHKKGISSLQLSRDLDVSQKTAWFMLHRLRQILTENAPEMLEGEISADETFVGGRNKFRHYDKKVTHKPGRTWVDKTAVLGLLQKDGPIRCFVIESTSSHILQPIVFNNVKLGSRLYTDDWCGYSGMFFWYEHYVIEHSKGKYKKGKATTNNIEGAWAHLKRSLGGIYHSVRPRHLQRYCNEFAFRWNTRHIPDAEKFERAVRNCNETRLLYKELCR